MTLTEHRQARRLEIGHPPTGPIRAALAKQLVKRTARRLPLRVALPDGTVLGTRAGSPVLQLHRPQDFYQRLGSSGLIGLGESYQAGDWDSTDLAGLLEIIAGNVRDIVPPSLQWLRRFHVARIPRDQDGNVANSRQNISLHYDLSNDLFEAFLDETMTYSGALFEGSEPLWDNLSQAQLRKIDRLLDHTHVGPGSRVLEIGTGWGALAVRAASRGATVHSVTLSQEQQSFAREYAQRAGVADKVDVRLCDYRLIPGERDYDAILSVEMVEAVGERYWPAFFGTLRRLLAPHGRVGLQAITLPHDRMIATRNTYTWIQKYIFPGGFLPSVKVIEEHSGLRVLNRLDFGADYAHTLRLWRQRFHAQTSRVDSLGFDEVFRRTWDLYLAYSQAGFASGYLNVHQFVLGGDGGLN